jgi:lipoprotein-releasing system permease protein
MIFLAIRYLIARKKQTLLTLLGIFFGTAGFILLSGIMLGFRGYLIGQLINNNPHIHIGPREDFLTEHSLDSSFYKNEFEHIFWNVPPSGRKSSAFIENPQNWFQLLRAHPQVAFFTPQLISSAILSSGPSSVSATLIGCDPIQQQKVTTIGDYLTEGTFSDLTTGGNRIILGEELRKKLGVQISQTLGISVANAPAGKFKVAGFFKTGNKAFDHYAYGEIGDIQNLNQSPKKVNEIAVRLYDHTQAAALATTWTQFGSDKIESWDQINASIFDVFKIQDTVRYLTIASILIVAGFGIYNVLNMTIMQKRKDIAILRSMGYSTSEVILLFFLQGFVLGIIGASIGLVFGYLMSLYLQTLPFGGSSFVGKGTGHLMVATDTRIYLQAVFFALASSSLASLLPALGAGRLTPIDIIRSGAD